MEFNKKRGPFLSNWITISLFMKVHTVYIILRHVIYGQVL